ncbi:hypothetical protein KCV07_g503, partial [Aureobasidium melanogenum]
MEFAFKKGLITPSLGYGRSALSTRACSTLVGCHLVGGAMLRHPACVANFVGCPRPKRAHTCIATSTSKFGLAERISVKAATHDRAKPLSRIGLQLAPPGAVDSMAADP